MTVSLNTEVRARLDAHLDAVERALVAAGNSRERRRGVVDDLEAQILDMLAGRSAEPRVNDLESVLAGLDPPAAYGESTPPAAGDGNAASTVPPVTSPVAATTVAAAPKTRFSRTAIWGFICILLSLVPVPLALLLLFFTATRVSSPPRWSPPVPVETPAIRLESAAWPLTTPPTPYPSALIQPPVVSYVAAPTIAKGSAPIGIINNVWGVDACVGLFFAPLGLAGTVLGWIAFGQILTSKGALRGTGLALFDGLFYPVMFCGSMAFVNPPFFLILAMILGLGTVVLVIMYLMTRVANRA